MKDDSLKDFVLDQLAGVGVEARAMFGGHGLYAGGKIFGIMFRGRLYLKTNAASRVDFTARNMEPFQPRAGKKLGNYYEVPADILEDRTTLRAWSERALAVAKSS